MIVVIEGLVMCFLMLLVCVVGISGGPVGCVFFYEKNVQERVVELGLTTKEKIIRGYLLAGICLFVPLLVFVPLMVYFINGARGFKELFFQIVIILMIDGIFDRIFIDWFWVGKTKAWVIPGTEDLMPYVPGKTLLRKWLGTIIGFPVLALIMAWIMSFF